MKILLMFLKDRNNQSFFDLFHAIVVSKHHLSLNGESAMSYYHILIEGMTTSVRLNRLVMLKILDIQDLSPYLHPIFDPPISMNMN